MDALLDNSVEGLFDLLILEYSSRGIGFAISN